MPFSLPNPLGSLVAKIAPSVTSDTTPGSDTPTTAKMPVPNPNIDPSLAETHGTPRTAGPQPLWGLLQEGVAKNPSGLALACQHHARDYLFPSRATPPDNNLEWTYSDLSAHGEHLAAKIVGAGGQKRGAVVTPFVLPGAEWAVVFWATARLNMALAPLDPKIIDSPDAAVQEHYLRTLTPHIVVVADGRAAVTVDSICSAIGHTPGLKIVVSADPKEGGGALLGGDWISLPKLLAVGAGVNKPDEMAALEKTVDLGDGTQDVARILFTGGSTGMPKGCPHTGANLTAESEGFFTMRDLTPATRTLVQSPTHHIMAYAGSLLTWRAGGGVVFPGARYDAGNSIRAIQKYGCTYLPVHHSMTDGLLRHPDFATDKVKTVTGMQVGGALISPDLAFRYDRAFGGLEVFPFWGSSEGMYTTACAKGSPLVHYQGLLAVGKAWTGGRVKVADPDTGATCKRGEIGELNYGGDTVISHYVGNRGADSFYEDANGKTWFKTGDQGRMADDGSIFMLGRFKDLIKRGGENIFPQPIEHKLRDACETKAFIIGVPDEVTGEACVAVVDQKASPNFSKLKLQSEVARYFGSEAVFSHIFTLDDLNLADFPLGPGGKVRKPLLRDVVIEHLEKQAHAAGPVTETTEVKTEAKEPTESKSSTTALVKSIWAALLHVDASELDDTASLASFIDSLTAMRYTFEVEKSTGKRLIFADLAAAPSIQGQADLLASMAADNNADASLSHLPARDGPPQVDDIVVCHGNKGRYEKLKRTVVPILQQLGFDWEADVADVYPSLPWMDIMLQAQPDRASTVRFAYEIPGELSFAEVKAALETAVKTQPLLSSLGVAWNAPGRELIFVELRPTPALFERMILPGPAFGTVDEAVDYGLHSPDWLASNGRDVEGGGLLLHFGVSAVPSAGKQVLTWSINHVSGDALSNEQFITALDNALSAALTKAEYTPAKMLSYKTFIDMHYNLRGSGPAHRSAAVMADKIRGLSAEPNTKWYPSPASSSTSTCQCQSSAPKPYRGHVQLPPVTSHIPNLAALCAANNLHPASLLKAAFSAAVMHHAGPSQPHFQFTSLDAGRSWPFQTPWAAAHLPNPLAIGGATLEMSYSRVSAARGSLTSTGLQLARQIQADDDLGRPHAHAPADLIFAQVPQEDIDYLVSKPPYFALNFLPDIERSLGLGGEGNQFKVLRYKAMSPWSDAWPLSLQMGTLNSDRDTVAFAAVVDLGVWDVDHLNAFLDDVLATLKGIVEGAEGVKPAVEVAAEVCAK